MPADREKVKELSIRIPNELWKEIEILFEKRHQHSIPKNQKVLTLIREAMSKYDLLDEKESLPKAE